jgi:hypothetical protein
VSKLGVELESDEELNNSFTIPDEIQDMVSAAFKKEFSIKKMFDENLISHVDYLPFSKKELNGIQRNCMWVESLVEQNEEKKIILTNSFIRSPEMKASDINNLVLKCEFICRKMFSMMIGKMSGIIHKIVKKLIPGQKKKIIIQ